MLKGIFILLICVYSSFTLWCQTWQEYRDSAKVHFDKNKKDQALEEYQKARSLMPADSLSSDNFIDITTNIANILNNDKGLFNEALIFYREAKEIILKKYGNDNDRYAFNANFIGQVHYKQRLYEKAEEYYSEAKKIFEKNKRSRGYAGICNVMGILYNDWGKYALAEELHLEARAIREQLFTKEDASYAQSCNNLAVIYWNLGQYDKAEPLALEAKEIRGRVANASKAQYAISLVNLANIYRDMGKFKQAEPFYIEAKNLRETLAGKDHEDYALSCTILADLYYFMKEFEKAEALYLEANELRKKRSAEKTSSYAQTQANLAELYRETGKYEKSEKLALEAGAIWQAIGPNASSEIAMNYNSLGALYFSMYKNDKAEENYSKARKMWKISLGEDHPYYTANTLGLARVYRAKKNKVKARELYKQAFETQHKQDLRMFSFTSEEEKQLYIKNIAGNEDEYQSFYFDSYRNGHQGEPYQISLMKRNQILSSSLQLREWIYNSADSILKKKYNQWNELKKQIAALYAKGEKADRVHLKSVESEADRLEKEMVRNSAAFKAFRQNKISWKEIREKLGPDEAAVEFIEFNYFNGRKFTDSIYYVAMVLRKGMKEPSAVLLFEKKKMDSLLRITSRGSLGLRSFYRGLRPVERVNPFSYQTIWKPMERALNGIRTVYFAPVGLLHRISFAALAVDSSKVLSDRYQLVQLSTTAAAKDQSRDIVQSKDKISLYGGILYSTDPQKANEMFDSSGKVSTRSGFNYLPGTSQEVNEIARLGIAKDFSPVVIRGLTAKENEFKLLNGKNSPAIIHIATHGFFFDDPSEKPGNNNEEGKVFRQSGNPLFRSGLLFAGANDAWVKGEYVDETQEDGILTAYEVSNLYLPGSKLVVLSACETALGDINGSEGVYGLQRSFKIAGVKNLVMSLWKVPDTETAEFMQTFYKNVFEGKAIDKSFYEAQKIMRTKYRSDPFKWAAWILLR